MITSKVLGKRIKFFRQRAKMSQMELELAIGASAGMVSRIENGAINPTKETILHLAEKLDMHQKEIDYLVGTTSLPATKEEIELAIADVVEYLDRESMVGYLTDERWRFCKISAGFVRLLGGTIKDIDHLIGNTIIEALVEKDSVLTRFFDQASYVEMLKFQLRHYFSEIYFMQDDEVFIKTQEAIVSNPFVRPLWEDIIEDGSWTKFYPSDSRVINFNTPIGSIPMRYGREPLLKYPRFDISEYFMVRN